MLELVLGFALRVAEAVIRLYLTLLTALLMALGRLFARLISDLYALSMSRHRKVHRTSEVRHKKHR